MDEPLEYEFDDGGRAAAGFRGDTGDCCTRAIAIAGNLDYRHVYDTVAAAMKAHGYSASGNAYRQSGKHQRGKRKARLIQDDVIASFGFKKVKLQSGPRPTYAEAHARFGNCIVTTTRHFAALVDGALRDTFDGREYDWHDETGRVEIRERKAMSVWVPEAVAA